MWADPSFDASGTSTETVSWNLSNSSSSGIWVDLDAEPEEFDEEEEVEPIVEELRVARAVRLHVRDVKPVARGPPAVAVKIPG